MQELENITSAVCEALTEGGISAAVCEFPDGEMKRYTHPVVAVGIKSGSGIAAGFAEYMGETTDPETQERVELFGKRLEVTLLLGIYSPKGAVYGAGGCIDTFAKIAEALCYMPSGLRIREITCGETGFDTATGMFLCRAEMKCSAFMYALRESEEEFLSFTLRGTAIG